MFIDYKSEVTTLSTSSNGRASLAKAKVRFILLSILHCVVLALSKHHYRQRADKFLGFLSMKKRTGWYITLCITFSNSASESANSNVLYINVMSKRISIKFVIITSSCNSYRI